MPNVSLDELLERIPSKFNLVMVVAKRARQIKDGAPRMVTTQSVNPVTAAMEEVAAGKLVLDGSSAHLVDDFGKPIRTAPDRLEELLGLSDDAGVGSAELDPLSLSLLEDSVAEPDPAAHEPAMIPDEDAVPSSQSASDDTLTEDDASAAE